MTGIATLLAQTATTNNDAYLVAAIVLGIIGLAILVIELFVPSGGLLAILCAVAFISSVVAMFMWSTFAGTLLLFLYVFSAPFAILLFLKLWSKSPIVRKYTLRDGPNVKVVSMPNRSDVDPTDPEAEQAATDDDRRRRLSAMQELVGQKGIVETPLRPIGFVRIGDRRLDASAESGLIEPGTPVRVIAVLDGTLKVRPDAC
jgi:membrane-bound ClpP family serine protease